LRAYQTAIEQPNLDLSHVVILAQNESSLLLAENFAQFNAISPIHGVILTGNMVNAQHITTMKTPIHIVQGEHDIHTSTTYASEVVHVHQSMFDVRSSFYIAENANRRLRDVDTQEFHTGARQSIRDWLESL